MIYARAHNARAVGSGPRPKANPYLRTLGLILSGCDCSARANVLKVAGRVRFFVAHLLCIHQGFRRTWQVRSTILILFVCLRPYA